MGSPEMSNPEAIQSEARSRQLVLGNLIVNIAVLGGLVTVYAWTRSQLESRQEPVPFSKVSSGVCTPGSMRMT